MELSPEKFKVMHLGKFKSRGFFHCRKKGRCNRMRKRSGCSRLVEGTWHKQVNSAASKAKRVQGLMKNIFSSWSDKIAKNIYPTFVRPHLEFASSDWNPHLEYDSKTLKSVQR